MRLPGKQQVQECGHKEKHRKNNGDNVKRLFNATAGAIHTAISTKSKPGIGSTSLKKDGPTQKHTENEKENIQNHIVSSVAKLRHPVKQV